LFPNHHLPADLADLVYARTEGSPLFMVDLLRYLREQGVIAEVEGRWTLAGDLPDQRDELPDDRRLLAAASVLARQTDEGLCEAELHRLRGEAVLRAKANAVSAEVDYRRALELARRRDARALQLRAAVSLARPPFGILANSATCGSRPPHSSI
jgi:hypothetical protein